MPEFATGEFSVYQFLDDDIVEKVRDHVSAEEAVRAAHHYCTSVAAVVLGIVQHVIITDGGDCVCFEWRRGEGVVFGMPGQEPPR